MWDGIDRIDRCASNARMHNRPHCFNQSIHSFIHRGPPQVLCYGEALVDRLGPMGGDPATDTPVRRRYLAG